MVGVKGVGWWGSRGGGGLGVVGSWGGRGSKVGGGQRLEGV